MAIDHIELKHTGRIVRKATCPDSKCGARVFTRTALGKREGYTPASSSFKMFCGTCMEETPRLYMHKRGMVCQKCLNAK